MTKPITENLVSRQPLVVIVANARGGVGKSTVAMAIIETMVARGLTPGIIEIETTRRLEAYYGNVVRNIAPVSLQESVDDAQRALAAFDVVTDLALPGDVVIDIGANEIGPFAEWAGMSCFAEDVIARGHRLALVAVTTKERESVAGALDTLYGKHAAFPVAERFLVCNELLGAGVDREYDLGPLIKDGIQLIPMPRCTSPMWQVVEGKTPLRLSQALNLSREDLERHYGMSRAMTGRALTTYARWYEAVIGAISGQLIR